MQTDLFDFVLPTERIALRPAAPRDAARLLVVRPGGNPPIDDRVVRDLPDLLRPGDQLVVNDTKVIAANLRGRRLGRGVQSQVGVTLIRRIDGSRWRALVKGAKKLAPGDLIRFGDEGKVCFLGQLDATVEEKGEAGEVTLAFAFHGPVLDQAIAERGAMPLPPYIASRRAPDERDRSDYQTLFAREEGAVAAPTAALHFTDELVARLRAQDIGLHTVTLHVGPGTFLPVKADDTSEHVMHAEWGTVSDATAAALNDARRAGGRIVAIGTTSLRLLESATGDDGVIAPFAGETSLFVTPGYHFRAVDVLMTNFHLPRSTLFMLVCAFSGLDVMQRAYAHAVDSGYRFYSYGDACLLFPRRSTDDSRSSLQSS
ncbi:MAG: tRNA preQ1(34) S-adenosylmethionine ribosyltransferase-isomerase QueA [Xanthobacteraceae bacterium]